jgi:hypothetical protein
LNFAVAVATLGQCFSVAGTSGIVARMLININVQVHGLSVIVACNCNSNAAHACLIHGCSKYPRVGSKAALPETTTQVADWGSIRSFPEHSWRLGLWCVVRIKR